MTEPAATIDAAVDRVAGDGRIDVVADRLEAAVGALPEPVRKVLEGDWLGVPLHPMLTDVTIGAWTAAFIADLIGGRDARPIARHLVGIGVVSAVPTMLTGLTDWRYLDRDARRVGVVHAATNLTATLLYQRSWRARRRARHGAGVAWGLVAATVATAGGHLGALLAYKYAGGDDDEPASPGAPPTEPTTFAPESVRIG